jgi:2-octaprenyl-6-methoxyphenol hydroxylase
MLRLARDLGMGVITALPFARRALMRHAAGLTGAKPRLMQGRKI